MSLAMTRRMRFLAGRLVVLAYLFCVLSPSFAMALGSVEEPCFDVVPVAVHHAMAAHDVMSHDMMSHDMMSHLDASHALHHHDGMDAHDRADQPMPAEHHDGGKMPGPCCATLCVVGIAADLPGLSAPLTPAAERVTQGDQSLVGRAPPLLYRPPIVLV